MRAITAKALALDPMKRYQHADELLADLKAAIGDPSLALDRSMLPESLKGSKSNEAFAATSPSKPD